MHFHLPQASLHIYFQHPISLYLEEFQSFFFLYCFCYAFFPLLVAVCLHIIDLTESFSLMLPISRIPKLGILFLKCNIFFLYLRSKETDWDTERGTEGNKNKRVERASEPALASQASHRKCPPEPRIKDSSRSSLTWQGSAVGVSSCLSVCALAATLAPGASIHTGISTARPNSCSQGISL